ncbi:MAG TPA: methyltransferase domain-containing protein [Bacteroidia bacterium]|nr:methyltransferase domain-containing protein [Bacteroidia bacterium]
MLTKLPLNKFLQSRAEVNQCTDDIIRAGLKTHGISVKDFDLRHIIPYLKDGDGFLDLGAAGSFIVHNHVLLNLKGKRCAIDLVDVAEHDRTSGVEYFKGSLMNTPFENESFSQITCLSVIEHEVFYDKFAKEVGRLLKKGGDCFISFDYCPEKLDTSKTKLFDLSWNILSRENVLELVEEMKKEGMHLTSEIDWTTSEMVINESYCSPIPGVNYTFGLMHFVKS